MNKPVTRTVYKIHKMNCPCEEQLIRMQLAKIPHMVSLVFSLSDNMLTVYHDEDHTEISQALSDLRLDSVLLTSEPHAAPVPDPAPDSHAERVVLLKVLGINFFFFLLEIFTGVFSNSMGLVADSLDMLADSFVYGLALFAVAKTQILKKRMAKISGYTQWVLALLGLAEVIRRCIVPQPVPSFEVMMGISLLALMGNYVCLRLLRKTKSNEVHMKASMIFTSNDIVINLGVLLSGVLVYGTHSKYPDLFIGAIVFLLVVRGAYRIGKLAT